MKIWIALVIAILFNLVFGTASVYAYIHTFGWKITLLAIATCFVLAGFNYWLVISSKE
jgi:hypothetical protein